MKIADRTPYRGEDGSVDVLGRAQGTLRFGLTWYPRIMAQGEVIASLNKSLGPSFVLLRNVVLATTEIELPLVLIGPPGIYLINVPYERGVYRARDDEWGKVSGDQFVPAAINLVQRTTKMARVLQIFLDRNGYKDRLVVEPILMAANPGIHIDAVRPAVRIVMSDALERFAISMTQSRTILNSEAVQTLARLIVHGPKKEASEEVTIPPFVATPGDQTLANATAQQPENTPFSGDSLGFSFDDSQQNEPENFSGGAGTDQTSASTKTLIQEKLSPGGNQSSAENSGFQEANLRDASFEGAGDQTLVSGLSGASPDQAPGQTPADTGKKKTRILGMSMQQLLLLAGILGFWLCSIIVFAVYIFMANK